MAQRGWAQEFLGAVADHQEMIASDRARRLRTVVGVAATVGIWFAWAWLVMSILYILGTAVDADPVVLVTAELGSREAVFAVLGLTVIGPIAVAVTAWMLVIVYRIVVDALTRGLPRAFYPLASPAVILTGLAVQWSNRAWLHGGFWRLYDEVVNVLAIASRFTPVVSGVG